MFSLPCILLLSVGRMCINWARLGSFETLQSRQTSSLITIDRDVYDDLFYCICANFLVWRYDAPSTYIILFIDADSLGYDRSFVQDSPHRPKTLGEDSPPVKNRLGQDTPCSNFFKVKIRRRLDVESSTWLEGGYVKITVDACIKKDSDWLFMYALTKMTSFKYARNILRAMNRLANHTRSSLLDQRRRLRTDQNLWLSTINSRMASLYIASLCRNSYTVKLPHWFISCGSHFFGLKLWSIYVWLVLLE